MKLITIGSAVLTGASTTLMATLISLAPVASAQPVPCTDPPGSAAEGTPCEPDGAEGPPKLVGEVPPARTASRTSPAAIPAGSANDSEQRELIVVVEVREVLDRGSSDDGVQCVQELLGAQRGHP